MKRILVTGAGGSAAANFVASLRMSGEPFHVVGTDTRKHHLELADVEARYLLPRADDDAYADELRALLELEEIEILHPQPDPEVLAIAKLAAELPVRTFLPSAATVALAQDKAAATRRIADAGVATPLAESVASDEELRAATTSLLEQRERVWVRAIRGAGARASLPVSSAEQASSWVRWWIEMRGMTFADFMVSEFLPGSEFAFQSLWQDGELVVSQARERLEYLFGSLVPSGQTSTPSLARTVHRDDVNEIAFRSVKALDEQASGVFCVDLKEDAQGRPLVTEVNAGRFFTTSNFFAAAGANMPYTYVRLAFGEDVGSQPAFNAVDAGLYWVRMVDMGYRLVREGEWTSRRLPR